MLSHKERAELITALLLYAKNEQADLSSAQRKLVVQLANEMKRRP